LIFELDLDDVKVNQSTRYLGQTSFGMTVWCSTNDVGHINEVALHWAWLVVGSMTNIQVNLASYLRLWSRGKHD